MTSGLYFCKWSIDRVNRPGSSSTSPAVDTFIDNDWRSCCMIITVSSNTFVTVFLNCTFSVAEQMSVTHLTLSKDIRLSPVSMRCSSCSKNGSIDSNTVTVTWWNRLNFTPNRRSGTACPTNGKPANRIRFRLSVMTIAGPTFHARLHCSFTGLNEAFGAYYKLTISTKLCRNSIRNKHQAYFFSVLEESSFS